MAGDAGRIRLLGELELWRGRSRMPLPASRKTRALLGYLLTTAREHTREHLCELFWDGPDDPRAGLRWSLSRLRTALGDGIVEADRYRVEFRHAKMEVDLFSVREQLAGGVAETPVEVLKAAAARFQGELLEGLDLPNNYRYHEWCVREREAARKLRLGILDTLVDRLQQQDPEEALAHARTRVEVDPVSEVGHIAVMRLLARLGRAREAMKQYDACRRILENELGGTPSADLERARRGLGQGSPGRADSAPTPVERPRPEPIRAGPLFGRDPERQEVDRWHAHAFEGPRTPVLFLLGEPGIGKTRLLEEVALRSWSTGGRLLRGRGFEAETIRPHGAWLDALRTALIPDALKGDLSALLQGSGQSPANGDRDSLFEGTARFLAQLAASSPVTIILDDVQWLDEASLALLHYLSRGETPVAIACAARSGELEDNSAAHRMVRALRREGRLIETVLRPLDRAATLRILGAAELGDHADRIADESQGNPLLALEMARAHERGDDAPTASVLDLIGGRLSRLDESGRELLPWSAAVGRSFPAETLVRSTGLPSADVLAAVDRLVSAGVLRLLRSPEGDLHYDFSHDLVRQVAYRQVGAPRRQLIHGQLARALDAMSSPDHGDIAHHAMLGGEPELAARAYLAAAQQAQRVWARAESLELANQGLALLHLLPTKVRLGLQVRFLRVIATPDLEVRRAEALHRDLERLRLEAELAGLDGELARILQMLSYLRQHVHDALGDRLDDMNPAEQARTFSAKGRCLAMMDRNILEAEGLLLQADRSARRAGIELPEIPLGLGSARMHAGDFEEAFSLLERALTLARQERDEWSQCLALAHLAMLELERGRPEAVIERCGALASVAATLGETSEAPFSTAMEGLARLRLGEATGESTLEAGLAGLRRLSSHAHLSYVLCLAAEGDLEHGHVDRARQRLEVALAAAESVDRANLVLMARAVLVQVLCAEGRHAEAALALSSVSLVAGKTPGLSVRTRNLLVRATRRVNSPIPPSNPTGERHGTLHLRADH